MRYLRAWLGRRGGLFAVSGGDENPHGYAAEVEGVIGICDLMSPISILGGIVLMLNHALVWMHLKTILSIKLLSILGNEDNSRR